MGVVSTGCLPLFPHDPRIQDGAQLGVTYTAHGLVAPTMAPSQLAPDVRDSTVPPMRRYVGAQMAAWWSLGRRVDAESAGWRLTASAVMFAAARGDFYYQMAPRWLGGWDAGVGAFGQVGAPRSFGAFASVGHDLTAEWRGFGTVAWLQIGARDDSTWRGLATLTLAARHEGARPWSVFVAAPVGRRPAIDCGTALCRPFSTAVVGFSLLMRAYTYADGRVMP